MKYIFSETKPKGSWVHYLLGGFIVGILITLAGIFVFDTITKDKLDNNLVFIDSVFVNVEIISDSLDVSF